MRPRKNNKTILYERAGDLRTLFRYFAVTRVLHCPEYCDRGNGVFSMARWEAARAFNREWKDKKLNTWSFDNRKLCHKLREAFNDAQSIPWKLIEEILGRYGDTGKRVTLAEAMTIVTEFKRIGGGPTYGHKGYILLKFIPREVEWKQMLQNPDYLDVKSIPGSSKRAQKIIEKWEAGKFYWQKKTDKE